MKQSNHSWYRFCVCSLGLIFGLNLNGQDVMVYIDNIYYTGNKKTNEKVIRKELDFAEGDSILLTELNDRIEINKNRLISTGLFNLCTINVTEWNVSNQVLSLEIAVIENWYLYPSIIFELADRSFNVWWKEMDFSLKRVNYGLRVDHLNLSGNKDRLKLIVQSGYTNKYQIEYEFPYLSRGWGMGASFFYATNRELGYITEDNKILFKSFEDERLVQKRMRTGLRFVNRTNAYLEQNVNLEFHVNSVDTAIVNELNPNFFLEGKTIQRYFALEYDFNYDRRNFPTYPKGGFLFSFNIKKEGFGIFNEYNNLSFFVAGEKYFDLGRQFYFGGRVKIKTNLIRNQLPYSQNKALGYGGDNVRGYELYVMDGADFFLLKSAMRKRLFSKTFDLGKWFPIKQFRKFPVEINLRLALETGYANEPTYIETNELSNRWLLGYGPALDILLINNFLLSAEYNFNHLGEHGLYLQSSFNF